MEFILSEGRLEQLKVEIARLTKRAAKLGVDAPKLTVTESDPRPYPRALCNRCENWALHQIIECSEHHGKRYAAYSVTIDNPIVALSDYSFSARIDHSEGIVTAMREGYAHKYKDAKPVCEHCRENRNRNTTYVFTDSAGNDIQVGSTCLKDFSGAHNAEQIANLLTLYYQLSDYGDGDEGWGSGGGSWRINTRDYLACVNIAIRLNGWVPKSAHTGNPTASMAMEIMYPGKYTPPEWKFSATADDIARADAAITWASGESESTNDYILTISNLAQKEYFDPKYSGFVASILPAFDRAESRKVEIRMREKANAEIVKEIYAPIKTRVRDIPVTVTNVRHFDSMYGVTTLVNMRTADNHMLSWFASRDPEFAIGEAAILTGTVKGYDEKYNATKMTRCNLTEAE